MSDIYPQKGAQTKFLSTRADIAVYGGSAGSGKALNCSTKIPTLRGVKLMSDIVKGDKIYTIDSQYTTVKKVHDLGIIDNSYSIYLDTGYLCDADGDHLWCVDVNDQCDLILKTDDLARLLSDGSEIRLSLQYNIFNKYKNNGGNIKDISGNVVSCKLLYKFECFYLGFACVLLFVMNGVNNDDKIFIKINKSDYIEIKNKFGLNHHYCDETNSVVIDESLFYNKEPQYDSFIKELQIKIHALKKIDRQQMLNGVMDFIFDVDDNGMSYAEFNDYDIANVIVLLASSLGYKCYTDYDFLKSVYKLSMYCDMHSIKRKRRKCNGKQEHYYFIKSIRRSCEGRYRCIEVDHPSRLFLITEHFVPTHNSYALLLEATRHINNPDFGAVIFRREQKQIVSEGGLRDTALMIYPQLGGIYRSAPTPTFIFPSGAKITFAHLNQENEVLSWQGSQIPMIGFDELTHYSAFQFNYMLSRSRSTCGVRPYIRCTTNPDSDSWVAEFLSWWIDQDTGYPIQERSGVIRYFVRINDFMVWGNSIEELVQQHGCDYNDPKSVTFVSAKITDNPILMNKDPGYLSNLKALSKVERARLLDGNWKVKAAAGMYFPRESAKIIDWVPNDNEIIKWVMSWDLAASESVEGKNPDWTIGLKVGRNIEGKIVVADMVRVRRKAADVRAIIKNHAVKNGRDTWVVIPQDPGQAGLDQIESYRSMLHGYTIISRYITKNKVVMAEPCAAEWQNGNILLVRGSWNEVMIGELECFPDGVHDDIVDALSAAVRNLPTYSKPDYSKTGIKNRFKVSS